MFNFVRSISSAVLMDNEPVMEHVDAVVESSIDYPQKTLPPEVWELVGGEYRMKKGVKEYITKLLINYKKLDITELAKEIHITGSIGTNQYTEESDVDVHCIVDTQELLDYSETVNAEEKTPEQWVKDVFKWYNDNRQDILGYIETHPVEVFIQLNPAQEYLSDAVYDFYNDKWIKGPSIRSLDYDPYEDYSSVVKDLQDVLGNTDDLLGELKRDVIDYDVINTAMTRLPEDKRDELEIRLKSKLREIETGIEELMANKEEWIKMRKEHLSPDTPEQALEDLEMVKSWKNKNALFKFLGRYQYLRVIKGLEEIMKTGSVKGKDIRKIKNLLGVWNGDKAPVLNKESPDG